MASCVYIASPFLPAGMSISMVCWSVRLECHSSSFVDQAAVVNGSNELWKLFIDFILRRGALWS